VAPQIATPPAETHITYGLSFSPPPCDWSPDFASVAGAVAAGSAAGAAASAAGAVAGAAAGAISAAGAAAGASVLAQADNTKTAKIMLDKIIDLVIIFSRPNMGALA
jgi:hypothetical protein